MCKKILIFTLGSIFKDYVPGGSEKILKDVAIHLGKIGHKIDIFCIRRKDCYSKFRLAKNVIVHPVLGFRQPFPFAYKTSPIELASIIQILNEEIKKHDIFYSHGSGLDFPFLYGQSIPTIISLRDFIYPETLIGAFNFRRDKLIVNSETVANSVICSIGQLFPDINKMIKLIPNGVDMSFYRKRTPKKIYELIGKKINKDDFKILLPHRTDPSKGIFETLKLLKRLKDHGKGNKVKLLIPRSLDDRITDSNSSYYKEINNFIEKNSLQENIIFHPWIPSNLMPEYYSIGDLTSVIGNFIEAFGSNTALESLSCGTPVIMARVGANRTSLPEDKVFKIDYGDTEEAEKITLNLIQKKDKFFKKKEIKQYLKNNFSYESMLKEYEKTILETKITKPLKLIPPKKNEIDNCFILAPWANLSKYGVYHDYEYKYIKIEPEIYELIKAGSIYIKKLNKSQKIIISDLINQGVLVKRQFIKC